MAFVALINVGVPAIGVGFSGAVDFEGTRIRHPPPAWGGAQEQPFASMTHLAHLKTVDPTRRAVARRVVVPSGGRGAAAAGPRSRAFAMPCVSRPPCGPPNPAEFTFHDQAYVDRCDAPGGNPGRRALW
jgi:hypothetical protein